MSAMQSEVYEGFRDMGAAEDKALKAATVLGERDDKLQDVMTSVKLDIAGVKGEQMVHRWMLGFILATNIAILFKLFSH